MRIRVNGPSSLAALLLLVVAYWQPAASVIAQDEGAPACGVRIENLSGNEIRFTLKNRKTDWLPVHTLPAGAKEPFLNRDEMKIEQRNGSWTYESIPLEYVYRVYRTSDGRLVVSQVPRPAPTPGDKCDN